MKKPIKEWKAIKALQKFVHNFLRFFKSRINVALTGGLTIVCGGLAAFTLSTAIHAFNNPLDFAPASCVQMYHKANEGEPFVVQSSTTRAGEWHASSGSDQGTVYYYVVSTNPAESDKFALATSVIGQSYDYQLMLMTPSIFDGIQGNTLVRMVGKASFFDSTTNLPYLVNGAPTDLGIYMEPTTGGYEVKSRPTRVPDGRDEAEFVEFCKGVEKELEVFLDHLPQAFRAVGVENPDAYFQDLVKLTEVRQIPLGYTAITLILALIGTPMLGLFVSLWIRLLVADRRHRLISQGKIERCSTRTAKSFQDTSPDLPVEANEGKNIEPAKPHQRARGVVVLEDFVDRHHLHPIFGEWVFRGAGLIFMLVGTLLASIVQVAIARHWGGGWATFVQGSDYYDSIAGLGSFILVIAVIVIISESRRNLAISAAAFFTLALTYYTVSSCFYFFIDCSLGMKTESIGDFFAATSGGNVFLSLGIFAIIGFFLFYNPPRWFINRKLFRAFSIIPALLALGSIIFSNAINAYGLVLRYWQSGFFFVRNFDGLVIGVSMEFFIFGFRTHLGRAYGEDHVDEQMERPIVQFGKNGILCGLVLFLTIIFYLIPLATRMNFSMGVHTFIYITIPFFLFLKPAGKNHKGISDIIYYILYAAAMGIPNLTAPFLSLFP